MSLQRHALYRFWSATGELLYVGITHHPDRRWRAHKKREWWHDVATITLETHPNRDAVLVAECVAIVSEKPRYNVTHNQQVTTSWIFDKKQLDATVTAVRNGIDDLDRPLTQAEVTQIEKAIANPAHWGPVL